MLDHILRTEVRLTSTPTSAREGDPEEGQSRNIAEVTVLGHKGRRRRGQIREPGPRGSAFCLFLSVFVFINYVMSMSITTIEIFQFLISVVFETLHSLHY